MTMMTVVKTVELQMEARMGTDGCLSLHQDGIVMTPA